MARQRSGNPEVPESMSDMAATIEEAPVRIRPITVTEFERMSEVGILGAKERVELLRGELIAMPPIGPDHSDVVDTIVEAFVLRFAGRARVGSQRPARIDPITEFQPDVILQRRDRPDRFERHPSAADVLLAIEVADSSLRYDRREKLQAYAAARIAEYWIVDLVHGRIEVHTEPENDRYRQVRIAKRGESVAPLAFPADAFQVDDLLPPPITLQEE
jgi:Uma2 family endonuclease